MALVEQRRQQGLAKFPQARLQRQATQLDFAHRKRERRDQVLHDRDKQAFLAPVQGIDGALRAADVPHEVVDTDAVVAAFEK